MLLKPARVEPGPWGSDVYSAQTRVVPIPELDRLRDESRRTDGTQPSLSDALTPVRGVRIGNLSIDETGTLVIDEVGDDEDAACRERPEPARDLAAASSSPAPAPSLERGGPPPADLPTRTVSLACGEALQRWGERARRVANTVRTPRRLVALGTALCVAAAASTLLRRGDGHAPAAAAAAGAKAAKPVVRTAPAREGASKAGRAHAQPNPTSAAASTTTPPDEPAASPAEAEAPTAPPAAPVPTQALSIEELRMERRWQRASARGRRHMRRGEYLHAAWAFERAAQFRPGRAETLVSLGHAWAAVGRQQRAIQVFRQALELTPEDPELLTALADLYLRQGALHVARRAYQRALELDPDAAGARRGLARSERRLSQHAAQITE